MTEPRQHPQSDAKEAKASPPDPKVELAHVQDLDVDHDDAEDVRGGTTHCGPLTSIVSQLPR